MSFKIIIISIYILIMASAIYSENSDSTKSELPYRKEAEQVALSYSGELYPPPQLTKQISHELELIRKTWGDSIPAVNINLSPWELNAIELYFDDTTFGNVYERKNDAWNQLAESLGLTYKSFYRHQITVFSKTQFNPNRMGELLIGFPGLDSITSVVHPVHDDEPYYVRAADGPIVKYFFFNYCFPSICNDISYLMIRNDSAFFIDAFPDCRNIDTEKRHRFLLTGSFSAALYEIFGPGGVRPEWVDTALEKSREIWRSEGYKWRKEIK